MLSGLISCSCPKYACKIHFYIFKINLNGFSVESNGHWSVNWELHILVSLVLGNKKMYTTKMEEKQSLYHSVVEEKIQCYFKKKYKLSIGI